MLSLLFSLVALGTPCVENKLLFNQVTQSIISYVGMGSITLFN